jgi:hypothetical protein
MKVFEPELLPASKGQFTRSKTRRKYARIQFIHSGVLTPTSEPLNDVSRYQLPIVVTLEPLHLGVLPSSVIPVLIAILVTIVCGAPLASKINHYVQSIAQKVREDERLLSKNK